MIGEPSKSAECVRVLFRMVKEATKEKGSDDFLGKVILKLQVILYEILF